MQVLILLLFYVLSPILFSHGVNATLGVYMNLIFTAYIALFSCRKIQTASQIGLSLKVVKLTFIAAFLLLITNRFYRMSYLFDCMLCPALFIMIYQATLPKAKKALLIEFMLILYVVNSFISFYERTTLTNIFETQWQETWENDYYNSGLDFIFRSTALLGYPLNNAFSTAVFMLAILLAPLKKYIKFALWLVGLIALLCFNARGATVSSVLFFSLYLGYEAFSKHNLKTLLLIMVICFISLYIYQDIATSSLMGRFATGELMDGSANERLRVWLPFEHMDAFDLLLGFTKEKSYLVFKQVKLVTMENWLADFIYHMGIPLTLLFIFLYYRIFYRLLLRISCFDRWFLLGGFLILSSLNNSLSMGSWPWIWVFCVFYGITYIKSNKDFREKHKKIFQDD